MELGVNIDHVATLRQARGAVYPDPIEAVRIAEEAGADLILGHHPHVLQPIETFDRSVIAYSLGNFAWHPRYGITGDTGVLEVVFDGSRIEGYRFHPHVLNYIGGASPIASGDRYDRITDIVEGRCEQYAPEPTPTTEPSTGSEGVTTVPTASTD